MLLRLGRASTHEHHQPGRDGELRRRRVERERRESARRFLFHIRGAAAQQVDERRDRARIHDDHGRAWVVARQVAEHARCAPLRARVLVGEQPDAVLGDLHLVVGVLGRESSERVRRILLRLLGAVVDDGHHGRDAATLGDRELDRPVDGHMPEGTRRVFARLRGARAQQGNERLDRTRLGDAGQSIVALLVVVLVVVVLPVRGEIQRAIQGAQSSQLRPGRPVLLLLLLGRLTDLERTEGQIGEGRSRHLLGLGRAQLEELHEVGDGARLDDDHVHLEERGEVPDRTRRMLLPELRAYADEGQQRRHGTRFDDRILHVGVIVRNVGERDRRLFRHADLGARLGVLHVLAFGARRPLFFRIGNRILACWRGRRHPALDLDASGQIGAVEHRNEPLDPSHHVDLGSPLRRALDLAVLGGSSLGLRDVAERSDELDRVLHERVDRLRGD